MTPTYVAIPYMIPASNGLPKVVKGRFEIIEFRGQDRFSICNVSKYGLQLNDLLKRGIPYDQAKNLFYVITA